jgi:membrane protease YdiL (CAAX protease family)
VLSEKTWPPELVLQLLVRLFASMFLGIVLVSWLNASTWLGTGISQWLTLVIGIVSFHGVALVLTHLFLRQESLTWSEAFGFRAPRLGRAMLLAFAVTLAVLPIAWSLGQLSAKIMTLLHMQPVAQGPVKMLETTDSVPLKVVMGSFAVVVAPFAEELVFRGLIYPTLKQQGFPRLALWGTSILFACIHSNMMILVPLTFLAVVLTLLYETTGNLLTPILAHSLFNLGNLVWLITQPVMSSAFPFP